MGNGRWEGEIGKGNEISGGEWEMERGMGDGEGRWDLTPTSSLGLPMSLLSRSTEGSKYSSGSGVVGGGCSAGGGVTTLRSHDGAGLCDKISIMILHC